MDTYDALTTVRPYKGAYTPLDACRELREEAARGWKHVEIVEAFIALLDSGGLERFEP